MNISPLTTIRRIKKIKRFILKIIGFYGERIINVYINVLWGQKVTVNRDTIKILQVDKWNIFMVSLRWNVNLKCSLDQKTSTVEMVHEYGYSTYNNTDTACCPQRTAIHMPPYKMYYAVGVSQPVPFTRIFLSKIYNLRKFACYKLLLSFFFG